MVHVSISYIWNLAMKTLFNASFIYNFRWDFICRTSTGMLAKVLIVCPENHLKIVEIHWTMKNAINVCYNEFFYYAKETILELR